ncbi:MAG: hypothetical protein GY830_09785 [Bacteroidetes bacterium]|nr:hypothetical protein [Bacteroidota bacterium]
MKKSILYYINIPIVIILVSCNLKTKARLNSDRKIFQEKEQINIKNIKHINDFICLKNNIKNLDALVVKWNFRKINIKDLALEILPLFLIYN